MLLSWFILQLSKKKAVLQSFKQLFPQTPVAVGDDILMAFGESENCMLIHG